MLKYFLLSITLIFILGANLQFTPWPEMLLWPYLILNGWLPYKDFAIAHSPLLPVLLAGCFNIFSIGVSQLKYFTWILIFTNTLLLLLITRKLFLHLKYWVLLIFYLILVFSYDGNGVWFDLLLVPFCLLTYYFIQLKKYLFAGLMVGLAFATKQTAAWIIFPIVFSLIDTGFLKNILKVGLGVTMVTLSWWLIIWRLDIFPDYWRWSIDFGLGTLPGMPGLPNLIQFITGYFPYIYIICIFFINRNRKILLNLYVWALFLSLGIFPRWGLFHFQPAVPFLVIFILLLAKSSTSNLSKYLYFGITVGLLLISLRYYINHWRLPDRFMEPSVTSVVTFIQNNSQVTDNIFVLNWWDHIYVLANRLPPKPWIPQLPWYMTDQNQMAMVLGLKSTPPKYIFATPYSSSGLASFQPTLILDYLNSHHQIIFYDAP